VDVSDDGCPIAIKFKDVNAFRSRTIERWAGKTFEPGACVASDRLAYFEAATKSGCKHNLFVTGDGPENMTLEVFTQVNTMIGNVKMLLQERITLFQKTFSTLSSRVQLPI
jgi:hypothetical protein